MEPTEKLASFRDKFLVVPGLLLNIIIAAVLLIASADHWTASTKFSIYVSIHRSVVSSVVQVVSSLLGALLTSALCKS